MFCVHTLLFIKNELGTRVFSLKRSLILVSWTNMVSHKKSTLIIAHYKTTTKCLGDNIEKRAKCSEMFKMDQKCNICFTSLVVRNQFCRSTLVKRGQSNVFLKIFFIPTFIQRQVCRVFLNRRSDKTSCLLVNILAPSPKKTSVSLGDFLKKDKQHKKISSVIFNLLLLKNHELG